MSDFVIRQWDLDPYPDDQAPPHVHRSSDEAFYVVNGELDVLVGDQRRLLTAGEFIVVEAGTVHTFANRGPAPSRILVVMTPQVDTLIDELHSAAGPEERDSVWARHDSYVVDVP